MTATAGLIAGGAASPAHAIEPFDSLVKAAIPNLPYYAQSNVAGAAITTPLVWSYRVSNAAGAVSVDVGQPTTTGMSASWRIEAGLPAAEVALARSRYAPTRCSKIGIYNLTVRDGAFGAASCLGTGGFAGGDNVTTADPYTGVAGLYLIGNCFTFGVEVLLSLGPPPSHGARNKPAVIEAVRAAAESQARTIMASLTSATGKGCTTSATATTTRRSASTTTTTAAALISTLPVVFVPGVAGSELQTVRTGPDTEVWPRALFAERLNLQLNPDGRTSTNGSTISAPDILQSAVDNANFYGGLVEYFGAMGYKVGQRLFLFPYDWRKGNAEQIPLLDAVVNQALRVSGKQQVVLVAHSMGGLISRAYTQTQPSKVHTIVTFATPWYGAPKVFYALAAGYTFGNPVVGQTFMKLLEQNMPAAYQLLPRIPFVTEGGRTLSLAESYRISYSGVEYYDLPNLPDFVAENPKLRWKPNQALLGLADAFHSRLGTKNQPIPLPGTVKLHTIIGYNTETLSGFELRDIRPGEPSTVDLEGRSVVLEPRFGDGDGTVPIWALQNSSATAAYYVSTSPADPADHAPITNNSTARSVLQQILRDTPPVGTKYEYKPWSQDRRVIESVDFTLHSAAELRVTTGDGRRGMANNAANTIVEDVPGGTMLEIDGVQHAAIRQPTSTYRIMLTGVETGTFRLSVRVHGPDTIVGYAFPETRVQPGTTATFTVDTGTVLTSLPNLVVTTGAMTTNVVATRTENPRASSGAIGSGGSVSDGDGGSPWPYVALGAVAIAGGALAAGAAYRRRRTPRVPPPPPV